MSAVASPAPRRTQAERVEASDRALIAAAIALIAERGYDRTTLAAIGETAGYSRGLVTQRFGSKEGLLWAVMRQLLGVWSAQALRPRVGERVGIEALRATLDVYLDAVSERPQNIRAYYALLREADGAVPAVRDHIVQIHRDEREAITAWIADGQRTGSVRDDVDPRAEAVLFLGVLRGVTTQWLLDPNHVDIVAALTQYGATLERTLGVNSS
jgi:AcrR family transcriptional regulator